MVKFWKRVTLGLSRKNILLALGYGVSFGFFTLLYQRIASTILHENIESDAVRIAGWLFAVAVLWRIIYYFTDNAVEMASNYINNASQQYYFDKLYKIKPEILKQYSTGYIASLVQKAAGSQQVVFEVFTDAAVPRTARALFIFVSIGQIYLPAALIGASLFISCLVFRLVTHFTLVRKPMQKSIKASSAVDKLYVDVLQNINTVQKMQAQSFVQRKLDVVQKEDIKWAWSWQRWGNSTYAIIAIVGLFWIPIMLLVAPTEILHNMEFWSMLIANMFVIADGAEVVSKLVRRYDRFAKTAQLLEEICREDNIRKCVCELPFMNLEVKDCTYSYVDQTLKSNITISIPNFYIERGDKVCIQGVSGQGKTTLLHLISQEIETDCVALNGVCTDKRLDCVFAAQDTEMFDMSIQDNLTLGDSTVEDEYLCYLLRETGLGDWYESLQDGLDTLLGERGVFISSGQRQRLNLIRALLQEHKEVFLLDEPTSNLDDETEVRVVNLIKRILHNKTVVIVTHRPAITEMCNRFYEYVDGTLHEKHT